MFCSSRKVQKPELLRDHSKQWIYYTSGAIDYFGSYYSKENLKFTFLTITGKDQDFRIKETEVGIYSLSDAFRQNISESFATTLPKYLLRETQKIGRAKPVFQPFGFSVQFSQLSRRIKEANSLETLFSKIPVGNKYSIDEKVFFTSTANGKIWKDLEIKVQNGKKFQWKYFVETISSPSYRSFIYEKEKPLYSKIPNVEQLTFTRFFPEKRSGQKIFRNSDYSIYYYFNKQQCNEDYSKLVQAKKDG
ncbi:MAG: hypothetical protein AAF518_25070, partial [Spirochaetota bacterium]